MESLLVEWFQQVVESMCLEGAQGVLIVSGREDNHRHLFGSQLLEDLKSIQPRHLDVEQNQIGVINADGRDGLFAVLTLRHNLDVGLRGKKYAEFFSSQPLVIRDDCSKDGVPGLLVHSRHSGLLAHGENNRPRTERIPMQGRRSTVRFDITHAYLWLDLVPWNTQFVPQRTLLSCPACMYSRVG